MSVYYIIIIIITTTTAAATIAIIITFDFSITGHFFRVTAGLAASLKVDFWELLEHDFSQAGCLSYHRADSTKLLQCLQWHICITVNNCLHCM